MLNVKKMITADNVEKRIDRRLLVEGILAVVTAAILACLLSLLS